MDNDFPLPPMIMSGTATSSYTQKNIDDRLAVLADRQDEEAENERQFLLSLKQD